MLSNKIFKWIIIGLLSVSLGSAVWWILSHSLTNTRPMEKLTIADASQPVFALLYIAEAKGYLKEEGLDVTYNYFTSGKNALDSALKGESDIATVLETPIVINSLEGKRISVLSTLHYSTRNTALIAYKDKELFADGDLVGMKIGVTRKTNAEFFLSLYLVNHGIELSDVTLVDINPEDIVKAFMDRTVDAIATWNPHLYNAIESSDSNQTSIMYSDIYTEMSVLAGKREIIRQKRDAMKRLLSAIIKAEEFKENNEEEAKEIVAKRLSNYSEDVIRGVWDSFSSRILLNNVLLEIFTQEAEWLIDSGIYTTTIPNFNDIVYSDLLNELKPESVTIFR
jgi:NitT/TauT family transport system substrate-binding protein